MPFLTEIFPDPDVLSQLAPEDLAPIVLRLAREQRPRPNLVILQDVLVQVHGPRGNPEGGYAQAKKAAAELALAEAWNWLKLRGLIFPGPGINGDNGWLSLSREAEAIAAGADIESFLQASEFPKRLLHPRFADDVWVRLARGDFDGAVFVAMRTVEEAVREQGRFERSDVGVKLMRAAFHPEDGPLTDKGDEFSERESLMHLFAGAIGTYKNPQSHRTVDIAPEVAREVVILASHLLRIVELRA